MTPFALDALAVWLAGVALASAYLAWADWSDSRPVVLGGRDVAVLVGAVLAWPVVALGVGAWCAAEWWSGRGREREAEEGE